MGTPNATALPMTAVQPPPASAVFNKEETDQLLRALAQPFDPSVVKWVVKATAESKERKRRGLLAACGDPAQAICFRRKLTLAGDVSHLRDAAESPVMGEADLESLLAQPGRDVQRAHTVMADDNDVVVGIQFLVRAAGHVAHGHEFCALDARRLVLPRFADVEQRKRLSFIELSFHFVWPDFVIHFLPRLAELRSAGRVRAPAPT